MNRGARHAPSATWRFAHPWPERAIVVGWHLAAAGAVAATAWGWWWPDAQALPWASPARLAAVAATLLLLGLAVGVGWHQAARIWPARPSERLAWDGRQWQRLGPDGRPQAQAFGLRRVLDFGTRCWVRWDEDAAGRRRGQWAALAAPMSAGAPDPAWAAMRTALTHQSRSTMNTMQPQRQDPGPR